MGNVEFVCYNFRLHIYSLLPENLSMATYFTMKLIIKYLMLVKIIKYCNIEVYSEPCMAVIYFRKTLVFDVWQGPEYSVINNFFEIVSFLKTFCHLYLHILDHKMMEWGTFFRLSTSLKLIYWKFPKANRQRLIDRKSRS